jgi:hypothetical protein
MSQFKLKIGVIVAAVIATVTNFTFTNSPTSTAKNDEILTEIANYRSWTRINKDPVKVNSATRPTTPSEIFVSSADLGG